MDIEFKEGAVCYAGGKQWYCGGATLRSNPVETATLAWVLRRDDFQLNTIKQGDFIAASELDTEQKYNYAVEVFGLFGFNPPSLQPLNYHLLKSCQYDFLLLSNDLFNTANLGANLKRKITHNQLMAIGELKRLEFERETLLSYGVYAPSKSSDSENPSSCEDVVNKPLHYQFFEGVEVIEIIASSMTREQFKGYCLGNRIKYRLRAGNKDKLEQEIAKSDKYVELYDEHKHLCRNGGDLK